MNSRDIYYPANWPASPNCVQAFAEVRQRALSFISDGYSVLYVAHIQSTYLLALSHPHNGSRIALMIRRCLNDDSVLVAQYSNDVLVFEKEYPFNP